MKIPGKILNNKGQSLVEFAIVLPILLLLVMGILEFGMMLNSYLAVQNGAREGARTGIVGSTDIDIQNAIISSSPSLNSSDVTVEIMPGEEIRKSGDTLVVRVNYAYHLTVPVINSLLSNTVNLSAETSMRVE